MGNSGVDPSSFSRKLQPIRCRPELPVDDDAVVRNSEIHSAEIGERYDSSPGPVKEVLKRFHWP